MHTVPTHPRPVTHPGLRARLSRLLHPSRCCHPQAPPGFFREDDPCPDCPGEVLFEWPWEPGLVVCPEDGRLYPMAPPFPAAA